MDRGAIDRLVDAWCEHDAARAFLPADRDAVEATRGVRALVCEEALATTGRDLLHACAHLGRMIADRGGSPSLLATTADGLVAALGSAKLDMHGVRVALAEGYEAARQDQAREEAKRTWDPPHCLVRIDATTVAIAAGFPDDDHDALEEWAAKVAQAVLASHARTAIVSGRPPATRAATSALTLVGVTVKTENGRPAKTTSWLPWRRNKVE